MNERSSRLARSGHRRLIVAAILLAAPAAADTALQDKYDEDAFCLAMTNAAAALPATFAKQKSEADTMRKLYAKRLPVSAKALGTPMPKALAEVDRYRRSTLADLNQPDPKKAAAEQADLVKSIQLCAALPVFEILGQKKS